jgi:hypothetical protein
MAGHGDKPLIFSSGQFCSGQRCCCNLSHRMSHATRDVRFAMRGVRWMRGVVVTGGQYD